MMKINSILDSNKKVEQKVPTNPPKNNKVNSILAKELKEQIEPCFSLNCRTLEMLSKINSKNVVEVLDEYKKISPKKSLAVAIDNEWGLDIKDVKAKICAPLAQRAKSLRIDIGDYKKIKDINALDSYINQAVKKIKAKEKQDAKGKQDAKLYKDVYNTVELQLVKRIKNDKGGFYKNISEMPKSKQTEFQKKAQNITKDVIKICEKYDVKDLSQVVAEMLGIETGGYNYDPRVLQNPKSKYKGALQTDLEACCTLYGTACPRFKDISGKYRESEKSDDNVYKFARNRHSKQDLKRIEELKAKYKTPGELYNAIQNNVNLGIEVGVLFLKHKISVKEGDVKKAIYAYGGKSYKEYDFNYAPKNINISMRDGSNKK